MACDPATLIEAAKCVQTCVPPGLIPAAQLAALCTLASGSGAFVLKAGDTMTGPLVMPADAVDIKFGGTTSAFTALKGLSTGIIQLRLADDSNWGILQAGFSQFNVLDANTNTQPTAAELYHETSGGAGGGAANDGVSLDWRADSDTVNRQQQIRISSFWSDATDATRTSQFRLFTVLNGVVTECLRLSNAAIDLRNSAALQMAGVAYFNQLTVYAAGTAYTLTNASSAVTFGTTSPVITVSQPGTYLVRGRVKLNLNGATFGANQTVTTKLRRTNNTATDLTNSSTTWTTPIVTTQTNTLGIIELPEVVYTTVNSNDSVTIFADVSVVPSAGSIQIAEASIVAVRLTNP